MMYASQCKSQDVWLIKLYAEGERKKMSLDKAILHGKEHRKPYYRSGRFDLSCRPHGRCSYCYNNRMYSTKKRIDECQEQLKEEIDMTEQKRCKLCGSEARRTVYLRDRYYCMNSSCDHHWLDVSFDAWNRLNSSMLDEINDYYQARGLKEPNALEALMWLISEVGELVEAYLHDPNVLEKGDILLQYTFYDIIDLCNHVEEKVASRSGWTRNNQPKDTYDLAGEAGDVLMLLEKFLEKSNLPNSSDCLRNKMANKLKDNGLL